MWWPTLAGMGVGLGGVFVFPRGLGVGQRINATITLQDLLKGQGKAVVRESERLRLVSISRTLAASIINRGLKSWGYRLWGMGRGQFPQTLPLDQLCWSNPHPPFPEFANQRRKSITTDC